MARKIIYEWLIEWTGADDDADILHIEYWDTLAEARVSAAYAPPGLGNVRPVISLRRDVYAPYRRDPSIDDLHDRQYAYAGDESFSGGAAIPAKYREDFESLT